MGSAKANGPHWLNILAVTAVALLLIGFFLRTELALTGGQLGAPLDDAWIHYQFARNLSQGNGFSFNPGEPTPGSTAPLWTVFLAGIGLFTQDFLIPSLLLSAAFFLLTIGLTYGFAFDLTGSRFTGLLAALGVAVTGRLLWAGLAGMETTAFAAFSLAAVWAYTKWGLRPFPALLFGLAGQIRPEGHALFALAVADAVWQGLVVERQSVTAVGRQLVGGVLTYGVVAAPYAIFSLVTTGHPLPNTFYAKVGSEHFFSWRTLRETVRLHWYDNPVSLVLLPVGLWTIWRRSRLAAVWLLGLPLFTAVIIDFVWHHGLKTSRLRWFFLAGMLYSLLTFLSLGNLALALPIGLFVLLDLWRTRRLTAVSLLKSGRGLIVGGLLLWLIYWWGWGVPPWAIVQTGLNQHYTLVTLLRRYDWWLVWNLVDVLVYAGWPLVLGFGAAVGTAVAAARARQLTAVDQLTLSLAVLLLFLDLSGSARGEVGRLWLFFMPLMAIPAAMRLADWLPSRRLLLAIGLQLAITVSLGLAWQPVRPVIVVAQPPPAPVQTVPKTTFNATFTETTGNSTTIHLLGADLPPATAVSGEPLSLTLYWQAERGTVRPYTVFTHLVAADGSLAAQQDNWPVNGQWPPTCWQPGEIVADRYQLPLPSELSPGEYRLFTGLYDARDGTRLTTATGSDAIHLTTITLSATPSP